MAIETEPGRTQQPGSPSPAATPRAPAWWRRPAWHTGLIGAVIGYAFGHWLGNYWAVPTATSAAIYQQIPSNDMNDFAIVLGYTFMVLGWLGGLGFFNDLFAQMLGRRPRDYQLLDGGDTGLARYFRLTHDHKVVGIQYLVGMIIYFCTAGLLAMGIRTELLSPVHHIFSSSVYIEIVGEHGTMMMMLMTLGHPRPVRQLPDPADDRLQEGRLPAAGSPVVLADPGRVPGLAVGDPARRLPHGLDRLPDTVRPGHLRRRRLRVRVRPDGPVDDPGRLQHLDHGDLLPGAWHALGPAADVRLGNPGHRGDDGAGRADPGRRHVHDHHRPDRADGLLRRPARRQYVPVSGPVLVLRPSRGVHPGAARVRDRLRDCCRYLPASRCSATRWRRPA